MPNFWNKPVDLKPSLRFNQLCHVIDGKKQPHMNLETAKTLLQGSMFFLDTEQNTPAPRFIIGDMLTTQLANYQCYRFFYPNYVFAGPSASGYFFNEGILAIDYQGKVNFWKNIEQQNPHLSFELKYENNQLVYVETKGEKYYAQNTPSILCNMV